MRDETGTIKSRLAKSEARLAQVGAGCWFAVVMKNKKRGSGQKKNIPSRRLAVFCPSLLTSDCRRDHRRDRHDHRDHPDHQSRHDRHRDRRDHRRDLRLRQIRRRRVIPSDGLH